MGLLSGALTTSLLLRENDKFVNRVDDLLEFPDLAIVAERGSAPERFFNASTFSVIIIIIIITLIIIIIAIIPIITHKAFIKTSLLSFTSKQQQQQ